MAREHRPFDRQVVSTNDLAVVVLRWIDNHDRRFNDDYGDGSLVDPTHHFLHTFYSARTYLAEYSGVPPRSIARITRRETLHTTYNTADKLVQAMERPDLWGTELHVIENPQRLPKVA